MPESITITRIFNAPIEKVWEAWTNPELLKQWMAPEGSESCLSEVDLKVGGTWRYGMKMGENKYFGRGIYQRIEKPTFLSYKGCSTNEEGTPVPHGESEEVQDWLIEITFKDLGGKTEMTLIQEVADQKSGAGAEYGWTGAFKKLEQVVTK